MKALFLIVAVAVAAVAAPLAFTGEPAPKGKACKCCACESCKCEACKCCKCSPCNCCCKK